MKVSPPLLLWNTPLPCETQTRIQAPFLVRRKEGRNRVIVRACVLLLCCYGVIFGVVMVDISMLVMCDASDIAYCRIR